MEPSLLGLVAALAMYAVSVSPSLMARLWWWHAAASGILMAVGYITGVTMQRLGARVIAWTDLQVTASEAVETGFQVALTGIFLIWWLYSVISSYFRARRAADLVDMPRQTFPGYVLGALGSIGVAALIISFFDALQSIGQQVLRVLDQWLPTWVAYAAAFVIVWTGVILLTSRVILRGGIGFFTRQAEKMNLRTARGIRQPVTSSRSGSEHSQATWESVGGQGRVFLGRGPSQDDIAAVTGRPAFEPIRVYAGMPTGGATLADRADLLVAELERTGAFDRSVISLMMSTGSGWVDEWQVQPLEYLTGGDCATASMQYSYVPSAINFLTGLEVSEEAAREMFTRVRQAIQSRPEGQRPALYVCGESLGAFASQSVFADGDEVVASVDGALWVGTPAFTPMHRALTQARHRGSPEVAPVFDNGRHIRFVNRPEDRRKDVYGRELGRWDFPRVLFAQHPSDPVVWWNSKLIWTQPDWLRERAGFDVSDDVEFTRFATFIQLLADLPVAGMAPGGHGHTYQEELIPLWESLLGFDRLADESALHPRVASLGGTWVNDQMRERISLAINANLALSDRQ
ncbi:alpha/beta hydrolase [Schaalia vaccimaxillae]|uniref:alpha/beta hydrolase n=1 Tax=Schaalia vaccimaxillae TaxID=183916 RepID=UPI0003B6F25A|nr:alpha/beta hydrolase [Schaalia vaccimaxillae]